MCDFRIGSMVTVKGVKGVVVDLAHSDCGVIGVVLEVEQFPSAVYFTDSELSKGEGNECNKTRIG